MASISRRGDYQYQAIVRRKGYKTQTKTFENRADAKRWACAVESEMDKGTFTTPGEERRITLADALERYKRDVRGRKSADITLGKIKRWQKEELALRIFGSLRSEDFAKYRDRRLEEGRASNTVRLELLLISAMYEVARREWGMENLQNQVQKIRLPSGSRSRTRRLSPLEERLMMESAQFAGRNANGTFKPGSHTAYLLPAIQLALLTAMRRGEICAFRWELVDLERQFVHLPSTKNGDARDVPLSPAATKTLRKLHDDSGHPTHGLAIHATPNALTIGWRRCRARARTKYEEECIAAGIQPDSKVLHDVRLHDVRHEAITRLAGKFNDVVELSKMSGHKSLQVLKRYYNPSIDELVAKLAA